jgi:hypothetical protein
MAIFNSYVKLPEGIFSYLGPNSPKTCSTPASNFACKRRLAPLLVSRKWDSLKTSWAIMEIRGDRLVLVGMKKLQHYWLVVEKPI